VSTRGRDGEATLEGVKVSPTSSYLEVCRYQTCRDENEEAEERRRRESLLRDLRGWQQGSGSDQRYRRRIRDWKEMASDFLCDLYSRLQAADAVSQRYFHGRDLLFPAHTRSLARLVEVVEELVAGFNDGFASELVHETCLAPGGLDGARAPNSVDSTVLQEAVAPAAQQQTTILVDMARVEALDALGDIKAAVAIVDRHV
jgi:hypothetical protein